jgi:hypothetical protein
MKPCGAAGSKQYRVDSPRTHEQGETRGMRSARTRSVDDKLAEPTPRPHPPAVPPSPRSRAGHVSAFVRRQEGHGAFHKPVNLEALCVLALSLVDSHSQDVRTVTLS